MGSDTSPQGCQAVVPSNTTAPVPSISQGVRLDKSVNNVLFNYYGCEFVAANSSTNDYFVPQATQTEFMSFLQNPPMGVTFANCVIPISYTATPTVSNSAYAIYSEGGAIAPTSGSTVSPITNVNVPTNQTVNSGIMEAPATTTVSVINAATMQPIQFFYTREDCVDDPFLSPPVCNTWIIRETQTITFTAPATVGLGVNSSWMGPPAPVVNSTYAYSTSLSGPWTPVTVNALPGGVPGIYNNAYQPPVVNSCTSGGVTYEDGQTWTAPLNTTQPPSAAECPFGAGTRVDDMQSTATYVCDNGTSTVQSSTPATEVGFTGLCATTPPVTPSEEIYVVDTDNNRVEVFDMNGNYQFQFGGTGSGNGQFNSTPWAIRQDLSGNLLVTDDANGRVEKFDPNGNYMAQFAVAGTPDMAAVAPSGNVWVTGVNNGTLNEFSSTFSPVTSYSGYAYPIGLAFDNAGNVWMSNSNTIEKLDASGNVLLSFGTLGTGAGQFDFPWAITVDPASGNLWVADRNNNRVQVFDQNGNFLFMFGSLGTGNGQFHWPIDIAFDPQGNVWITDMENNRVEEFDKSGNYKLQFGSLGSGNGQFSQPIGITISAGSGGASGAACTTSSSTPPSTSYKWDGAPNAVYASGQAPPLGNPPNFTQLYTGDFSQPLDPSMSVESAPPGGSSVASYTPSACIQTGGFMRLQTANQGGGNWTSCQLEDWTFAQTYGKYLVRFRADMGDGVSPTMSMWEPSTGDSEFAFENWAGTPGFMQGVFIDSSNHATVDATGDFTQWHTMGIEWTPGSIVYTIDGTIYDTTTGPWVPSAPMGIQLQQELTFVDAATPAVSNFDVNWIQVYSYTPGSTSTCTTTAATSCLVGGVTYAVGQTFSLPVTSTQAPTSTECPFGAGTRVDDMQSTTTYVCNSGGTASAQSSTTPTETGYTGACAVSGGGPAVGEITYYEFTLPANPAGYMGTEASMSLMTPSTIVGSQTFASMTAGLTNQDDTNGLVVPGIAQPLTASFGYCVDAGFQVTTAGTYNFVVEADDGVAVWIDGNLIFDYEDGAFNSTLVTNLGQRQQSTIANGPAVTLTSGLHDIQIQYYDSWIGYMGYQMWLLPPGQSFATSNCPEEYATCAMPSNSYQMQLVAPPGNQTHCPGANPL